MAWQRVGVKRRHDPLCNDKVAGRVRYFLVLGKEKNFGRTVLLFLAALARGILVLSNGGVSTPKTR